MKNSILYMIFEENLEPAWCHMKELNYLHFDTNSNGILMKFGSINITDLRNMIILTVCF